jgi:hypothetical protein
MYDPKDNAPKMKDLLYIAIILPFGNFSHTLPKISPSMDGEILGKVWEKFCSVTLSTDASVLNVTEQKRLTFSQVALFRQVYGTKTSTKT